MFITVEGIPGAGVTTQARLLAGWLNSQGLATTYTHPAGGTTFGEGLDRILSRTPPRAALAECLCRLAEQAEHVSQVVWPTLKKSVAVVSDRFTDWTLAYYGGGRGLDRLTIQGLCRLAAAGREPTHTILLDLSPTAALARRHSREGLKLDAISLSDRIRVAYLELATENPDRFIVLDAARPIRAVHQTIASALGPLLPAPPDALTAAVNTRPQRPALVAGYE